MNKVQSSYARQAVRVAASLLSLGALAASPLQAAERIWSKGTTETDFINGQFYTPTGALDGSADLVFDSATHADLALSTGLGINSLEIRAGANGFILNGPAYGLTMHNGGVTVRSGANATFNTALSSNGAAQHLTFTVESGGSMTVNGLVKPVTRPFYKKGAGTLILNLGTGTNADNSLRTGTALHIQEGTLLIGNAAKFEPGTSFGGANLDINIGTTTTQATLAGGGTMVGVTGKSVTVNTFGATHSTIAPGGDGTLEIQHLNAAAGATFHFELGNSLLFGSGKLTGSTPGGLALELSGGDVGELYTLFDYGQLVNVNEASFAITSEGYEVDFWEIVDGQVRVQFLAVPEPSVVSLVAGVGVVGLLYGYRRRTGLCRERQMK